MQSQSADSLFRYGAFAGFLLIWQVLVLLSQPELVPGPMQIIQSLYQHLSEGELLYHLKITLFRVLISFVLALVVGFIIGVLMGRFDRFNQLLDVLVTLALNVPALVVIILCFIWLGLNDKAAILAVVLNKMPIVIVTCREGVRAIDKRLLGVADVFKLSAWQRFSKVFFPQLYPYVLTCIRTGLSLIWKIVLVVELIGCSNGVGFQLGLFFQYFDITSILAYTLAFAIVILLIESLLIQPWERKISEWRYD